MSNVTRNMTPFEIRLELLKMAKDMLDIDYFAKKDTIHEEWHAKIDSARNLSLPLPDHPGVPPYPSEADVIQKAMVLNGFVSQVPLENKASKK